MAGPCGAVSMNSFIDASESQQVQVQKALCRSRNTFTATLPFALRAWRAIRMVATRKAGKKRQVRTRRRVTEMTGIQHLRARMGRGSERTDRARDMKPGNEVYGAEPLNKGLSSRRVSRAKGLRSFPREACHSPPSRRQDARKEPAASSFVRKNTPSPQFPVHPMEHRAQRPELPKPLPRRTEPSRASASSIGPVKTGTGII